MTKIATLLATSSRQLCPDMYVFAGEVKSSSQRDELILGAALVLSTINLDESETTVLCSLPLSRMCYYSPPIMVERQVAPAHPSFLLQSFALSALVPFLVCGSKLIRTIGATDL